MPKSTDLERFPLINYLKLNAVLYSELLSGMRSHSIKKGQPVLLTLYPTTVFIEIRFLTLGGLFLTDGQKIQASDL